MIEAGKNPLWCLIIPNKLFLLWDQRRSLERQLRQEVSQYTEMANDSLSISAIKLNTSVVSLETRLATERCRFHARYKKSGGALRIKLSSKYSHIILLQSEISPTDTIVRSTSTVLSPSPTVSTVTVGIPRSNSDMLPSIRGKQNDVRIIRFEIHVLFFMYSNSF